MSAANQNRDILFFNAMCERINTCVFFFVFLEKCIFMTFRIELKLKSLLFYFLYPRWKSNEWRNIFIYISFFNKHPKRICINKLNKTLSAVTSNAIFRIISDKCNNVYRNILIQNCDKVMKFQQTNLLNED